MEEEIIENICMGKKWYQKIIIHMFKKQFIEAYHVGRIECFNSLMK